MFSMRIVSAFIPNRSRPGITTTVTSDWAPRATGGHATWVQRRGGRVGAKEGDEVDWEKWKILLRCGDPK